MAKKLAADLSRSRRIFRTFCVFATVFFLILALLRPQYALKEEQLSRKGHDIVIVLDTSLSMAAQDISPTRFEHAKQEILALLQSVSGDRVGLVLFSGSAFVACPLTLDYAAFQMFLDDAQLGSISRPGTNLAAAIETARRAFRLQDKRKRFVIVLSDGESFEGDAQSAAKKAADEGLRIYCLGIGTANGDPIPVRNEAGQIVDYKRDGHNQVVLSKLNQQELASVAEAADGGYIGTQSGELAMGRILWHISAEEGSVLDQKTAHSHSDRFEWFLFPALLFWLGYLLVGERRQK
jgi:Ca-activated chloride channel family protein